MPKEKRRRKKNFVFLPASPKKGEVGLEHRQRKTAEGWLKSEYRDCWVGGEKIRLLCPTEVFASLGQGRKADESRIAKIKFLLLMF